LQQILIKKRTISHFFQETSGILTGNRQQLKEAVDPGEGFMDPGRSSFTTNDCFFIGGPEKVKRELDYFIEKLKLTN
jgi:hypothetical protein